MASDDLTTTIDMLFSGEPAVTAAPSAPEPSAPQPQPIVTEQLQPAVAPAVDPASAMAPAAPEPQSQAQRVPLAELMDTRRRAQEAERQNAQLIEALQRLTAAQQPQQAPQPAPEPIDPVADPERAYAALQAQMQSGMLNMHLNMSERYARAQFGDETVNDALKAALESGYAETFKHRADPYKEMVQWHQAQKLASEIGTDPVAYRARIANEIKAEILASLRSGQPAPQNLPPTLAASANATSAAEVVPSTKAFFNEMMSTQRTNRG